MYGYEGTDVFEVIKNVSVFLISAHNYLDNLLQSKTKRCYTYTGIDKDGDFYPLHVATESGHKNLAILLVKAGADVNITDYRYVKILFESYSSVNLPFYRGCTAEDKCTGNALHAFYELRGLKYEAKERYQGKTNGNAPRVRFYLAEAKDAPTK